MPANTLGEIREWIIDSITTGRAPCVLETVSGLTLCFSQAVKTTRQAVINDVIRRLIHEADGTLQPPRNPIARVGECGPGRSL